jgi:GDP-4-dehydro-6-deoxy-D-mannose reductase
MSNRILVTGAAGFVGGHLLRALLTDGAAPAIVAWRRPSLDRATPSPPTPDGPDDLPGIQWKDVNILDPTGVAESIREIQPTQIYHCAGVASVHSSWSQTLATLEGNVRGTDNLLRAVASTGITSRVLVPGSALVYQPSDQAIRETSPIGPTSPYGLSKLAQEMLAQQYAEDGLAVLLTRSFTHIGPGQTAAYAASSFAKQIAEIEAERSAPIIKVGALDARRDLTDVRDTVRAYISLMQHGEPGRLYNVCSGLAYRIGEVLNGLMALATVPVRVDTDKSRLRPNDNLLLLGDPTRLTSEIGWEPHIPLTQTLEDLLTFWRSAIT